MAEELENNKSRREFIKKAAYSVPVIVGLGAMVVPMDVEASKCNSGFKPKHNRKAG